MVQFFLTHFVEVKRWQDIRKPKSQGEKGSFFGLEGAFECSGEPGMCVREGHGHGPSMLCCRLIPA